MVADGIAKRRKPFCRRICIKVAEMVCPDKKHAFLNVSLSHMTIMRRVEEIGSYVHNQLHSGKQNYVFVLLANMSPRTLALQLNFLFSSKE